MTAKDPDSPQDDAARAGWLSYVGGLTQDQIAAELGISRQRAQRLVSRAMAEGLIHVRLNHRIGACLELEQALREGHLVPVCFTSAKTGAGIPQQRGSHQYGAAHPMSQTAHRQVWR